MTTHYANVRTTQALSQYTKYHSKFSNRYQFWSNFLENHIFSKSTYIPPPPPSIEKAFNRQLLNIMSSHKMESHYLTNICNYQPSFYHNSTVSVWHKIPVARRASVMVLLFLGKCGELRVILTKRSNKLKNFSGHISLPGGKADTGLEDEWTVARRECEEEIGISRDNNTLLQSGFEIQHINQLPTYLSRTFLGVRPCVGFINWSSDKLTDKEQQKISQILLNPGESSSIFSVPLKDFLQPKPKRHNLQECLKQSYIKTRWGGIPWNLRSFVFPMDNEREVSWLDEVQDLSSEEDETEQDMEFGIKTRNVWGLTANILHDLAEITYNGESETVKGEEDLIRSLSTSGGQMKSKERSEYESIMIRNVKGHGFKDVLPEAEFEELQRVYAKI